MTKKTSARLRKPQPLPTVLNSYGRSKREMCELLGVSRPTYDSYLAVPGLMRLEHLDKLIRAGADVEELASAVFGVKLERRQ